jgi:hypothetical protein
MYSKAIDELQRTPKPHHKCTVITQSNMFESYRWPAKPQVKLDMYLKASNLTQSYLWKVTEVPQSYIGKARRCTPKLQMCPKAPKVPQSYSTVEMHLWGAEHHWASNVCTSKLHTDVPRVTNVSSEKSLKDGDVLNLCTEQMYFRAAAMYYICWIDGRP